MTNIDSILSKLTEIEELLRASRDEFLPLEVAAEYLGFSTSTMYKMTHENRIAYYKPGGKKLLFKRSELDRWVESHRIATADELDTKAANAIVLGSKNNPKHAAKSLGELRVAGTKGRGK